MKQYPHLSSTPIVEALIDIRVKPSSDFDMVAFLPLRARLAAKYPQVQEVSDFQLSTEWKPGTEPRASGQVGSVRSHLLRSDDGRLVSQFRRDGFTFSRLNPYSSWEEVFSEAWLLWKLYLETARPVEISRLAVRYINRLSLPGTNLDLYMKTGPVLAEGWPSDIGAFLSRLVLLDLENQITINIVQLLEPQTDPNQSVFPVIFDIDAFQDVSLSADDVTIAERFAKLRETKNRIFFEGLTPEAIELFR
jgi:uncharacterized protein (TIGR04255 family)